MTKPKIVVVIPTCRAEQYKLFIAAWEQLFKKHKVTLVTVYDGEIPYIHVYDYGINGVPMNLPYQETLYSTHKNLIYRYTDACRNLGFIASAHLNPDYVLTLDDDVAPIKAPPNTPLQDTDPIQAHLLALQKFVPLGWMNTAHKESPYLRGVPYGIRDESPVMLSHGVWEGTPDFDGETQLRLEGNPRHQDTAPGVPYTLPYYVGPIPRGVLFPLCGMNVMVRREALPYLYFAPMGVDTKIEATCPECGHDENYCSACNNRGVIPLLNRFADIWMGNYLKRQFDDKGWACYTGGSTILHTRASDAKKNFEQEKLGREWNEFFMGGDCSAPMCEQQTAYMLTYAQKREEFRLLIESILKNK